MIKIKILAAFKILTALVTLLAFFPLSSFFIDEKQILVLFTGVYLFVGLAIVLFVRSIISEFQVNQMCKYITDLVSKRLLECKKTFQIKCFVYSTKKAVIYQVFLIGDVREEYSDCYIIIQGAIDNMEKLIRRKVQMNLEIQSINSVYEYIEL